MKEAILLTFFAAFGTGILMHGVYGALTGTIFKAARGWPVKPGRWVYKSEEPALFMLLVLMNIGMGGALLAILIKSLLGHF